jgi:NitT/TauT family transport system permease protein
MKMDTHVIESTEELTSSPGMRWARTPNHLITTISIVVVLILAEVIGRRMNPLFASYPSAIAVAMFKMTVDGSLVRAFLQSMEPFLEGFAIAALLGIPLGVLIGRFRTIEAAIGIYITAGYAMPLVALVPLYILWFGLGVAVKVAMIATLTFFPICINAWLGVKMVPRSLIEVGLSFVGTKSMILRKIVLPASVPYIMAGLRLGVGKAIIGMIVAEFFTAISGLGGIIINAANAFQTAQMLAPVVVIMVFAVAANGVIAWLERKIAPWHQEITGQD